MDNNINQELNELSPALLQIKEQGDGFTTPPHYFSHFDEKLSQRIAKPGVRSHALPQLKGTVRRNLWPVVAAVAATLVLVLCAVWLFRADTNTGQLAENELTSDDIEIYLMENAADFEPEQLAIIYDEQTDDSQSGAPLDKTGLHVHDEMPVDAVEEVIDEMTDEELEKLL